MIIDAKAVAITLFVVGIGFYAGLHFIRRFALSIAQENHDANMALDTAEEDRRRRLERDADAAAASAFAKVEPLLPKAVAAQASSMTKPKKEAGVAQSGLQSPTAAPSVTTSTTPGSASMTQQEVEATKTATV